MPRLRLSGEGDDLDLTSDDGVNEAPQGSHILRKRPSVRLYVHHPCPAGDQGTDDLSVASAVVDENDVSGRDRDSLECRQELLARMGRFGANLNGEPLALEDCDGLRTTAHDDVVGKLRTKLFAYSNGVCNAE